MLLLPKGHYVFRQERLAMDEVMSVKGQVFIINARPAPKDGQQGMKLEMLTEQNAIIIIQQRKGDENERVAR